MKVWSGQELKAFLSSQKGQALYPLWLLLATTGMRRGEVLGLTWGDIDLTAARLAVTKTRVMLGYDTLISGPKTRRGKRLITLDPATVAALMKYRQSQEALNVPFQDSAYVFTDQDGEPYHPERVSKLFRSAAKQVGLPPIRLHDLRHTYATLALGAQVHPKIVSERLGHANIGITLDCYSHCLPALSEEAAARVAALVVPD